MKIWLERALAALRWGWEKLVSLVKWAWAKLVVIGNTLYDPPPVAYKRLFFLFAGIFVAGGLTFAFVNSWYYKPTAQYLADISRTISGDDGDVALPKLEPLPSVPTPAIPLPPVELVCFDASDTPHCEPIARATPVVETVKVLPPVAAKAIDTKKKNRIYRRKAKRTPLETYWGF